MNALDSYTASVPSWVKPTDDLDEYKRALVHLMDHHSKCYFPNHSSNHASVVYEVFLEKAKKDVRMFCSKLCAKVFDRPELERALRAAVARGVNIQIISEEKPDESIFLKALKELAIPVKTFGGDVATFNFCVVDSKALRFEEDNKTPKAFVNMNDEDTALKLVDFFDNKLLKNDALRVCQ